MPLVRDSRRGEQTESLVGAKRKAARTDLVADHFVFPSVSQQLLERTVRCGTAKLTQNVSSLMSEEKNTAEALKGSRSRKNMAPLLVEGVETHGSSGCTQTRRVSVQQREDGREDSEAQSHYPREKREKQRLTRAQIGFTERSRKSKPKATRGTETDRKTGTESEREEKGQMYQREDSDMRLDAARRRETSRQKGASTHAGGWSGLS